jgi:restriction system protein
MAIWLVRAGGRGEQQEWALDNNKVVNGWDDVNDLSKFNTKTDLLDHL